MLVRTAALAATLALTVSSAAAFAGNEPVSAPVSTRGLDLGTDQGIAHFRVRVAAAIDRNCRAAQGLKTDRFMDHRCVAEMQRDADAKLAALRGGQSGMTVGTDAGAGD